MPEGAIWTSFLPGWPDGSFGWAKVDQQLTGDASNPRLYVEYVGHGDSDKPLDYPYGTIERADLVEAHWKAEGIASTFIVGFDYSSIVALELLSRQQERLERGDDLSTRIEGVLLINGGLIVDAHTHPWYTTPILKSPLGGWEPFDLNAGRRLRSVDARSSFGHAANFGDGQEAAQQIAAEFRH